MSYAVLFSGQGTQHANMWPWLPPDDALVVATQRELGVADWRRAIGDDLRWAARNRHAQVLLTGLSLAVWSRISTDLPAPSAGAGYSVGELAAFSVAGVFDAAAAIRLAALRADAMDRCSASAPGGLMSVGGLAPADIEALCTDTGASVAIRIDVDSVVLGGRREALRRCEQLATPVGGKCTPLNVEVPSHTPLMLPAADAFAAVLADVALRAPATTLFSNVDADRVNDADTARRALSRQIAQTVVWSDCMDALHARRVECVLEIGPGSALATMWNRRHPDVPARSADEFGSAESVVQWLLRRLDESR